MVQIANKTPFRTLWKEQIGCNFNASINLRSLALAPHSPQLTGYLVTKPLSTSSLSYLFPTLKLLFSHVTLAGALCCQFPLRATDS
jgi:hypothetical protein